MRSSTLKKLILYFPVIFLIHDLEEIVTIEQVQLPFQLPFTISAMEFTIAFVFLWIIVTVGCLFAANGRRFLWIKPLPLFSLLVAGVFLANGIGHVLQAIVFQKYVPGVITAVLVLIPYCIMAVKKLYDAKVLTVKQIAWYLIGGFLLQTPAALSALLIGKSVVALF
ncbi:HXXEE domain-containing protein [Lysinibacillus sp. NPDC096418]|uniref:HXXEE domain-containing protein n=1 Tax=Lysinibacillus sp. NPDC096418 TaxID=3364138 RepID=UPI0037F6E91E